MIYPTYARIVFNSTAKYTIIAQYDGNTSGLQTYLETGNYKEFVLKIAANAQVTKQVWSGGTPRNTRTPVGPDTLFDFLTKYILRHDDNGKAYLV